MLLPAGPPRPPDRGRRQRVAPHLGEGRLGGGDAFRFAGVTVFGFDGDLISRVESYIVPLEGYRGVELAIEEGRSQPRP
jgi:hypothetical protein